MPTMNLECVSSCLEQWTVRALSLHRSYQMTPGPTLRKPLNPTVTSTARLMPWFAGLSLVAFSFGANLGRATTLSATTALSVMGGSSALSDSDLDGIADAHEEVLGLSPDSADTDQDGWSDSEELTRGSNPKDKQDSPKKALIGLDVSGYADHSVMHIVTSVYLKGGLGSGHKFQLGAVHEGEIIILPPAAYLPFTEVTLVSGRGLTDAVYILDMKLPRRIVASLGDVSFFARTKPSNEDDFPVLASMNMTTKGGVPYEITPPAVVTGGNPKTPRGSNGGGGFYTPLVPPSRLPAGASQGQVCVQRTRVVGSGGSGVQLEVLEADCVDGDGVCPAGCKSTVGLSFNIIDPILLIGG